jgi:hypothetical protein
MSSPARLAPAPQSAASSPDDEGSTRKVLPPSRAGTPRVVNSLLSAAATSPGDSHTHDAHLLMMRSPAAQQPLHRGDGPAAEQFMSLTYPTNRLAEQEQPLAGEERVHHMPSAADVTTTPCPFLELGVPLTYNESRDAPHMAPLSSPLELDDFQRTPMRAQIILSSNYTSRSESRPRHVHPAPGQSPCPAYAYASPRARNMPRPTVNQLHELVQTAESPAPRPAYHTPRDKPQPRRAHTAHTPRPCVVRIATATTLRPELT